MSRRLASVPGDALPATNSKSPGHRYSSAYAPSMQTVFVFPPSTLFETTALPDATMPGTLGYVMSSRVRPGG